MVKLSDDLVRSKTFGCLFGVFEGDALGLPCECQSPSSIRDKFGYVDKMHPNMFHPYKTVAIRQAGTISDDSQLSLALMESLSGGYDLGRIKQAHVEALDGRWGKPVGWGNSTRVSVQSIKANEWMPPTQGGGNGTCMKIAPLAIYCVLRCRQTEVGCFTNSFNASLLKKCAEITQLTHGDPRCIVATYCQARMIIRAMQNEIPLYPIQIAELFVSDAQYAEGKLNVIWPEDGLLSARMSKFLLSRPMPEVEMSPFDVDTGKVSTSICISQSSYVMNSYPFVAYCAAKYLPTRNFRHIVCETVNAGADADSNGAMVGAIAGALFGHASIPMDWFGQIKQHQMLLRETTKFWKALR